MLWALDHVIVALNVPTVSSQQMIEGDQSVFKLSTGFYLSRTFFKWLYDQIWPINHHLLDLRLLTWWSQTGTADPHATLADYQCCNRHQARLFHYERT